VHCLRKKKGILCPVSYIYMHSSNEHSDVSKPITNRKHNIDGIKMTSTLPVATIFDSSDGK
jgi:hypothetical protein